MLEVERWPELSRPVLLVALSGWIDAGLAGAGAVAHVGEQLEAARRFGRVELDDIIDLQQTRPTVRLVDGVTREVEWPSVELVAGRAGRDVVLCHGPEPSTRWHGFTTAISEAAARLDVSMALMLGGMPAAVSHRRPAAVLATASSRSLAQEVGALRADYVGPTGIQTVLQVVLGDAGIPTVGLWAQVPHYVGATPSPPAIRALLERVRDLSGVEVDLAVLDEQVDEYRRRVDDGVEQRPDVAAMVRQIEEATDPLARPENLPTGDELVSEIERFLRDER